MDKNSRTCNSKKNFIISGAAQILTLVITFVSRAVFIKILNADYLGINGLFSNILSILAFSELGISSAIIYSMYKPASENNVNQIAGLINLYKNAYRLVALIIALIGFSLLPWINNLINGTPDIRENIALIYALYLINIVCSYLFSYRKSLNTVFQKEYRNVLIDRSIHAVVTILQLIYLYYTHDFYGYLVITIVETLLINLITHWTVGNTYRLYLDNKNQLKTTEKRAIFSNIYNIFFYKIGSTILTSTSNIIISKLLSLTIVGIYSNYLLIITTLESILSRSLNSIVASIGNLNAGDNVEIKRKVMNELVLIIYWIYGFCSIELYVLLDDTIRIWIGTNYLLCDKCALFAAVLTFYVFGTNFVASNFRVTMGYFREGRFVPILAAIINILLSILLGKLYGLPGILISTSIARILSFGIFDPIIVLNKGLKSNPLSYYKRQIGWLIITIATGSICVYATSYVSYYNVFTWFEIAIITASIIVSVFFLFSFRSEEFKTIKNRFIHE